MRKTGWRRLLALAACAAMALGLLPGATPAAKADDIGIGQLFVGGVDIVANGGTVRGNLGGEAELVYNFIPNAPVLMLKSFKYSGEGYSSDRSNYAIYYSGSVPLGIYSLETNEITCTPVGYKSNYGICSETDIYFFGPGTGRLKVSAPSSMYGKAIYSAKSVTIKTSTLLEATGSEDGIVSQGLTIESSTVVATGSEDTGISCYTHNAVIQDSTVTVHGKLCGIYSGEILVINNSTFEATGNNHALWSGPVYTTEYLSAPAGGEIRDPRPYEYTVYAPGEATPAKRVKFIPIPEGKTPLVYDRGSGSGQMDSVFVAVGDTYTFPECTFTAPPYHTFDHWKMSGVDGIFSPGKTVTIASNCVQDGKITVTAHWKSAPQAAVTKAPEAKDLTYTGEFQKLVTEGKAENGAMAYALGGDSQTPPTGVWSDQVPEASRAGTYYVWYKAMGDETHSDSDAKCVTVKIKKAAQAAPAAPTAENVTETSVTLKAADRYQYSLDGTAWQDSNVFSGLTPNKEYTFYQRIAGDENHEPSPASPGTSITPGTVSYLVTDHKGTEHTIGSGENAVYTVKRNVDDGETFTNYSESTVDGKAIPEGGSSVKEGSLILTLESSYLDTLSEGTHQVGVFFKDGSVKSSLKIVAATPTPTPVPPDPTPTPKPKPVPRTGDTGNPALWIILGLAGIAGLAALGGWNVSRKKKKDR